MANDRNGRDPDRGTQLILEELRDLRLEMRADRREAAEGRRRSDEAWRQEWRAERRRSDDRFEQLVRTFREDSARREAATQKAFKQIHTVGLAIVKTLNRHTRILEHHTRILERVDRKLGARNNGRPGPNGGRT